MLDIDHACLGLLIEQTREYAIGLLDPAGCVSSWNIGDERLHGYQADSILGRHFSVFYAAEAIASGEPEHALAVAKTGTRWEKEGWCVRKDGSRFWASTLLIALTDQGGPGGPDVIGFARITRDLTERRRAEEERRDAEAHRRADELFRTLVESAPDATVIVDRQGVITLVNEQTEKLFGYGRAELLGRTIEVLVPERFHASHAGQRVDFFAAPRRRPMGAGLDLVAQRKGGTEFPAEISLSPIASEGGFSVIAVIRDISERKRAEALLLTSLHEKDVLLREVHHRVKNNLQVISSLLNLQAGYADSGPAREMFRESQNRVRSMALVHERLYRTKDLARIDLGGYLEDLITELLRAYGIRREMVRIEVTVGDVFVEVDAAVPCGLIVTEVISNCLKHAFPGGRRGAIALDIQLLNEQRIRLTVSDDGGGLPAGFDFKTVETLGLRLVSLLVEQLDGEAELVPRAGGGAEFRAALRVRREASR